MKKVIFNLKSYFSLDEMEKYKKEVEKIKVDNLELVFFPPILYLTMFKDFKYKIGTQNFFSYNYGSFTGELNLESLKPLKINYTLIGHPERKRIMEEKFETIKEKLYKSLNSKFCTVLCVGELKKMSNPFNYIKKELIYLLKEIEKDSLKYLSIAYEPSWAIGTGEIQDIGKIEKTVLKIKKFLNQKFGIEIDVYYGGSIDEENISDILKITDGIVIGAQSRDIEKVKKIIKEAQKKD